MNKILRFALALTETVVNSARIEGDSVVVGVRPYKSRQRRCPLCGRVCEAYDGRGKPRRWRALDLGASKCYLEYAPVRVRCPEHGVHVEWHKIAGQCLLGTERRGIHALVDAQRAEFE